MSFVLYSEVWRCGFGTVNAHPAHLCTGAMEHGEEKEDFPEVEGRLVHSEVGHHRIHRTVWEKEEGEWREWIEREREGK